MRLLCEPKEEATVPDRFPLSSPLSRTPESAAAQLAREGHAPVVAVLVPAVKKSQRCPSRPPKGVNHGPPRLFPC
jgi:hypothetical protein